MDKSADIIDIDSLLEAASCPVCLERLAPTLVCCINGHAICCQCRNDHPQCPTCQMPFSLDKHNTLVNLIEILPSYCRHEGCGELSWDIQVHKKFCEFRPVQCKVFDCDWKGSVEELYEHLSNSKDHNKKDLKSWPISGETVQVNVIKIEQQYFWRTTRENENVYSIQFNCVPKQDVKPIHWIEVKLAYDEIEYTGKVKLSFNELADDSFENLIIFNMEIINRIRLSNKGKGCPLITMYHEYRAESKVIKNQIYLVQ